MKDEPPQESQERPPKVTRPPKQVHSSEHPRPFPETSQANFRVACNEIADELSKSWRFKLHVGGLVITALIVFTAALVGIIGWSISESLKSERQHFQEQARQDIGTAKQAVDDEITEEFKKENVQKTLDTAVAKAAPTLFAKSIEPSIKAFQQKLETSEANLDKRLKEFDNTITKNEKQSASDVETLRTEVSRLQKRNNLTALGDKAISEGDVESYHQLENFVNEHSDGEDKNAALSELFRVFEAYSPMSGVSRTAGVTIDASKINPKKTKEEELEVNEVLPLLRGEDFMTRTKGAEFISKRGKQGSYKTAEAIVEALKKETNLEALKALDLAFQTVTRRPVGGKLDKRELLQWWEENKERLKKEDTDTTPTPTQTPQPQRTAGG
jgi:hypothetical protein